MEPEINSQSLRNSSTKASEEKIISYSKNVFLPVTNLCRNKCSYCGFRQDPENAWIMTKEEIIELAKRGKKAGCSEALITLGEKPETHEMMKEKLEDWGYKSTIDYLRDISKELLKLGLLPHTNPGVLDREELKELRNWNASMGLMLECSVQLEVHEKSPGKDPETRLKTIEKAGELKIPFTTGILVGIGESWEDRINSLLEIRRLQEEFRHIQEVIIQPFVPKEGTPMENESPPKHQELLNIVFFARRIMPDMNIQVPPNLISRPIDFLLAGANDLGGMSTVTPDFINPQNPWPNIEELDTKLGKEGFDLRERLSIYPKFVKNSDYMRPEVEEVVKELSEKGEYLE